MPTNYVHGRTSNFQVETDFQSSRVIATARNGIKLSPAGQIAVLAAWSTYYSGLSAAQKASLPDTLLAIGATTFSAAVVPNTEVSTVNTLLTTTLAAAGNTVVG